MSYVNINTLEICDAQGVMNANPNTSFPSIAWTDELLAPFGYAELHMEPDHPTPNQDQVLENGVPYLSEIDGKWYLPLVVRAITSEEETIKRENMVITPLQAKTFLLQTGKLSMVEDLINAPDADPIVKLAWENATTFDRQSSLITGLAYKLGWTDSDLDSFFTEASAIYF